MNLLFLNKFYFNKGGSETIFFEEIKLLEKNGHKVIPFSRNNPNNLSTCYSSFFVPYLNLNRTLSAIFSVPELIYSVQAKNSLAKLLRNTQINIAHCHNIYGILTTSVLDELYGHYIPTILTLHDYKIICPNYKFLDNRNGICEECKYHKYHKAIIRRCVKNNLFFSLIYAVENTFTYITRKYSAKVAKFIAPSRFIMNKFVEYGFPMSRIEYVPNFINTERFVPSFTNKGYFLYFGRLGSEKGIQTLIEAFMRLRTKKHKLVVVGEGPLSGYLRQYVMRQGIDNIEFLGFLTGSCLQEIIRNCICVIVPSEWYENCPMSILESFAYGKPVIAANIGGIPELVVHEDDGLIFTSGDVENLAEKLEYVARLDNQRLKEMGRKGRSKVERDFSSKKHYEALMELYSNVIHNNKQKAS